MAAPWLCDAGTTFRGQVDDCWPNRDRASDGWIGDDAHCPGPSDHCPAESNGVVRAIDLDRNLSKADPGAMDRLTGQLRRYCRDGKDHGRVAYIIWDGLIASATYGWVWRPYSGTNPHKEHGHISFLPRGDDRGGKFELPIFTRDRRRRLARILDRLGDRREKLDRRIARTRTRLRGLA